MFVSADRLFHVESELVVVGRAPRLVAGDGRKGEHRREGPHRYGPSVGQEFQDAQPAVAAVAVPLSVGRLGVEHHLRDRFAGGVLVRAEADRLEVVRRGVAFVAADDQPDVRRRIDELVPNRLLVVGVGQFVGFRFLAVALPCDERVGQQDHPRVRVPGFRNQFARPFDRFVARCEFERYDQQIAPRVGVELVGGVLQRGDSVRVVAYRYDFVTPALVARHREVVGEARQAVLRLGVSVVVVARADDVGQLVVEPLEGARRGPPLLGAGLVGLAEGQRDGCFILFDQIARAERREDAQRVDLAGDPCRLQLEQRLVGGELGVALRVGNDDDREGIRVAQAGAQGVVLGLQRQRAGEQSEKEDRFSHVTGWFESVDFMCAVRDDDGIDFGFVAEPLGEFAFGRGDEIGEEVVLHEVDRAAAEAAAHHACPRDAAFAGHVDQEVELLARYFVVLRQPLVRGVHPLPDGGVVATLQGVADVEHTPFLADHEACTAVVFVGDLIADRIEPLHRGAAQKLLSQHLRHALARLAPAVVGRADQFVLDDRIEQHELVTDGIEGEVFELHRTAVEPHQTTLLAEDRGELVHDAALHAAVVVLGRLTDACQFELVDPQRIEVVERKGEGRLQRCRRRHARSQRYVARKGGVEAADAAAAFLDFAADAEDVAGPRLGGFVLLAQAELRIGVQIDGVGAHAVGAVGADHRRDAAVDGTREDEAAVVVGVFAD